MFFFCNPSVEVNYMDDVGQTLLNWASAFGTQEMVSLEHLIIVIVSQLIDIVMLWEKKWNNLNHVVFEGIGVFMNTFIHIPQYFKTSTTCFDVAFSKKSISILISW